METGSQIVNDSVKATLFGKFYERIVREWLKEKKGFIPFDRKPRIYWKDVEFARLNIFEDNNSIDF